MSQVSRPVQLALLAVVVLGALWFFALRPHTQSTTSTPAPTPAPAPAPAASAPTTAPKPYNTKTPVIGGMLGAVNKANAAVAASNAQANQQEHNFAATSSPSSVPQTTASATTGAPGSTAGATRTGPAATAPTTGGSGTAAAGAASAAGPHAATAAGTRTASHAAGTSRATTAAAPPVSPALRIKSQLAAGKTVAVLFWNPLASDDQAVHSALKAIAKRKSFVVYYATAAQLPSYGTIVTAAQVLETPTLLIMRGKSIQAITDLQDPADLRQYVNDLDAGGPGEVLTPKLASYTPGISRVAYLKRANALCLRVTGNAIQIPVFDTPEQILKIIDGAERRFMAKLASIPAPVADRAYLHHLFVIENRADAQYTAAFSTTNPVTTNGLLLSAESNDDYAVQGLKSYGLVDCVVPSDN